jgi:hypothetical protein
MLKGLDALFDVYFLPSHSAPLGLRYSVNPSGFLVGAPAACFATHGNPLRGLLCAPCQQLRCMTCSKAGRKRLFVTSLSRAAHEQGTPSLDPRACLRWTLSALTRVAGCRVLQSKPGARATPPLRHTTARAVYGLGACHFDKPPSAVLSCVICSTHVTRGSPALRLRSVGQRLDALPPTARR